MVSCVIGTQRPIVVRMVNNRNYNPFGLSCSIVGYILKGMMFEQVGSSWALCATLGKYTNLAMCHKVIMKAWMSQHIVKELVPLKMKDYNCKKYLMGLS